MEDLTAPEKSVREDAVAEYRQRLNSKLAREEEQQEFELNQTYPIYQFAKIVVNVLGATGSTPTSTKNIINYVGERFVRSGSEGIAVLYTCAVCGQDHPYPVSDAADFGRFLVERESIASKYMHGKLGPEEQSLALLQGILKELKTLNEREQGKT